MDGELTESLGMRLMCKCIVIKGVWEHGLLEKLFN